MEVKQKKVFLQSNASVNNIDRRKVYVDNDLKVFENDKENENMNDVSEISDRQQPAASIVPVVDNSLSEETGIDSRISAFNE